MINGFEVRSKNQGEGGLLYSSGSGEQAPDFKKRRQGRDEVRFVHRKKSWQNGKMTLFPTQANGSMTLLPLEIENISIFFSLVRILRGVGRNKNTMQKQSKTKTSSVFK